MSETKLSKNINSYFDRNTTLLIKGIAILLMFVHHFFTFPQWYISGISYPELEDFAIYACMATKMCVAVFAFLTGYAFVFNKSKNMKYVLKKFIQIYLPYWTMYLIFLILAFVRHEYKMTSLQLLNDIFGFENEVIKFCWYLPIFVLIICGLTLLHKVFDKHWAVAILVGIIILNPICMGLLKIYPNCPYIYRSTVSWILAYFSISVMGYVCARYEVFSRLFDAVIKKFIKIKWVHIVICVALIIFVFAQRTFSQDLFIGVNSIGDEDKFMKFSLDLIYLPIFIYALANILPLLKWKPVQVVLSELGKYSLYMWLLHSVFFGASQNLLQPVLYFPHNPVLVTVWGLVLCYIAARIIDIPVKWMSTKLSSLLFDV